MGEKGDKLHSVHDDKAKNMMLVAHLAASAKTVVKEKTTQRHFCLLLSVSKATVGRGEL